MKKMDRNLRFIDRTPCIKRYLEEIKVFPVLSIEEEIKLIERVRDGEFVARTVLIHCNLRLALRVARCYVSPFISLENTISFANEGLVDGINAAILRWDATRGFKLMSYVVWYIHCKIREQIPYSRYHIRLPISAVTKIYLKNQITDTFQKQHGVEPSFEVIREIASKKEQVISDRLMEYQENIEFFSESASHYYDCDNCSNISIGIERGQQYESQSPDYLLNQESLRIEIHRVLNRLPQVEAEVLSLYYGLVYYRTNSFAEIKSLQRIDGFAYSQERCLQDTLTCESIAILMGLTKERIRQIKEKALKRIRKNCYAVLLKGYLN